MNKHALSYGVSAVLISATLFSASYGLHKKNETITDLKVEATILNAEKEDVMSTNSQLSEHIKSLESDFRNLKEQLDDAGAQIEKLNKENKELEKKLHSISQGPKSGWTTFTATYYDADYASTGKSPGHPYYGITASGEPVREGVTVAVDPRVIPLGSWVEVKYPDGRVEKRKATDTGGAIKGNKIDIYIASANYTSGKHPVQVRIIN